MEPGAEQETQAGALVLCTDSGFNWSWRWAGLHRHQPREGPLLDGSYQRLAGAVSSRRHSHCCCGQEADARPTEFAAGVDCRGNYHNCDVRRGRCDVRFLEMKQCLGDLEGVDRMQSEPVVAPPAKHAAHWPQGKHAQEPIERSEFRLFEFQRIALGTFTTYAEQAWYPSGPVPV